MGNIFATESGSEISSGLAFIPFAVLMIIFALLYSRGKNKYAPYINALNKKDYALKDFFPVGFSFLEIIRYPYSNTFDRTMRQRTTELYTAEFSEFYLRVTYAQAVTAAFIGLLLGSLIFGAMNGDITYLILGIGLGGVLGWASFKDVKKKVEERHTKISMELPELTNQILILSGAGLTLKGALIKIAKEMPAEGPLYVALQKAVDRMSLGATDEQALDGLVSSCNTIEVRRFVSVLLQNMHRGGTDVLIALSEIGKELWAERRATAQRIAEETSTKLLFPMVLMLLAVIILVAVPAVMSMGM